MADRPDRGRQEDRSAGGRATWAASARKSRGGAARAVPAAGARRSTRVGS